MVTRRDVLIGSAGVVAGTLATGAFRPTPAKPCKLAGTPLDDMHTYLCAFHVAKNDPNNQVIAHHYCMAGDGLFQCIILDSNKKGAKVLGVEYIVSEDIYKSLPEEEKEMWHPHAYEVTSGLLVAPDMTQEEEDKFLDSVKNTWGKSIHTWKNPQTKLPLGKPELMAAFTKDGQVRPELVAERDRLLGINTEEIRKRRSGK